MRLITGDEVGLVKVTTLQTATLTPMPNKKLKSMGPTKASTKAGTKAGSKDGGTGDVDKEGNDTKGIQTRTLGTVDRSGGIQFLVRASNRHNVVVVARASGVVEYLSLDSGEVLRRHDCFTLLKQRKLEQLQQHFVQHPDAQNDPLVHQFLADMQPGAPPKLNKQRKTEHFVGLHEHNGTVVACTDLGHVFYLNDPETAKPDLPTSVVSLGQDRLFKMRVHPGSPHLFATGGEERDLCLWDIHNVATVDAENADADDEEGTASTKKGKKDKKDKDAKDADAQSEEKQASKPLELLPRLAPIWIAKNVRHDFLDMRVPVWITEIQWLSDDTTMRLVTGTGHHQVRVYDTVKQRRPTLDVSVGDHPIKTIGVNASKSEFVLADTTSNMTSIDAKTGKVTGRFSGIAGAVTQTVYCTSHDYVISVGVDRKLRLFEGSGRHRMVKEIYLKQRLTALLVDEDWTPESDEAAHAAAAAGASESEIAAAAAATGKADDEDLWENMAQADDEEDEAEAKPAKAIRKKRKQPSV